MTAGEQQPTRTILIVEDDPDQCSSWERERDEFNEDPNKPFRLNVILASNEEDAYEALASRRVDGAVVDLRLPEHSGSLASAEVGRRVFEKIFSSAAMPIVLLSAHPEEQGDEIKDSETHVIQKGGQAQTEALRWLGQREPLMGALRAAREEVRRRTAAIFFGHIWKRWEQVQHANVDAIRKSVVRQIVAHVGEDLLLDQSEAEQFDLVEFYFVPPINKERIQTGDLCEYNGNVVVILSPRCDMARTYPNSILVAHCINLSDRWKELGSKLGQSARKTQREAADKEITKMARQNVGPSQHFLPPCGNRGPWLADFSSLSTVSSSDIELLMRTRFASISPQFVPHIIQRFTAFIGRVGQPGLSVSQLSENAKLSS